MREWQSLSHVRWYCRYHVVFVPKYRKRAIFGNLRQQIGKILRELCVQHEIELVEGHAMPDHVHLLLSIPPKFSIANTVGFVNREVGDSDPPAVLGQGAELHRVPLLGPRVLREHRGLGRGQDPQIHPRAGGGRETTGTASVRGA